MSTLTLAPTITRSAGLPSPKGSTLLRKCACGGNKQSDDEKRKSALLQRKGQRPITAAEEEGVPAVVDTALRSGGEALPEAVRHHFEAHFGHDFSQVKIHTDGVANERPSLLRLAARRPDPDRPAPLASGAVQRVISLQYNPETLTRTLQPQATEAAARFPSRCA
jgi:ribosomal protein S19